MDSASRFAIDRRYPTGGVVTILLPRCDRQLGFRLVIETLTIVHITAAAAWFGHKLLIPGDVHASIRDVEGASRFVARIGRARRLGLVSGVVTIGTGVWLVYEVFGFTDAPIRIWTGLGSALAIFVVAVVIARPAWKRIRSGMEDRDPASASSGVVRFRQALMLENLLWVLALVTMVLT